MAEDRGEVTHLLGEIRAGNRDAETKLIQFVYSELRRLAAHYLRGERVDHNPPAHGPGSRGVHTPDQDTRGGLAEPIALFRHHR